MPVSYVGIIAAAEKDLSSAELETLDQLTNLIDEDIDSWCGSSIACCDACYDDYISKWPLAYRRLGGLSDQQTDVGVFYDSARRVQGWVTKAEFNKLVEYVACPRCSAPIGRRIFAFELPFEDAPTFEKELERLGEIALIAPFLVLTDPLAIRVKEEISKICKSLVPTNCNELLYRGRSIDAVHASPSDFEPPPATTTREGRYNHAGRPVIYLGSSPLTCWEECRKPTTFSVASVKIQDPLRILDITDGDVLSDVLAALTYSNLMTAPSDSSGWDRPESVLSRFVADCARFEGVDAIRYPSSRCGTGDNVVILDGSRFSNLLTVEAINSYSI